MNPVDSLVDLIKKLNSRCCCTNLADPNNRGRFAGYERHSGYCSFCKDAEQALEILAVVGRYEKTLSYYANPDNWHIGDYVTDNAIDGSDAEPANGELSAEYRDYVAGKRARKALSGDYIKPKIEPTPLTEEELKLFEELLDEEEES